MTTEADFRVTQPHVTEAERSSEAERGEECIYSLLRTFRGSAALFDFKLLASGTARVYFSCVKSTNCGNVLWRPGEMDIIEIICPKLL